MHFCKPRHKHCQPIALSQLASENYHTSAMTQKCPGSDVRASRLGHGYANLLALVSPFICTSAFCLPLSLSFAPTLRILALVFTLALVSTLVLALAPVRLAVSTLATLILVLCLSKSLSEPWPCRP